MTLFAWLCLVVPVALAGYSYVLYPALLWLVGRFRRPPVPPPDPSPWPLITICVPAYNEAASIEGTLEGLLAVDYPADRRQILVLSDASTDGTDEVVRRFQHRGVDLLRLPSRAGKTGAENAAVEMLRGSLVVNTDATIRIPPASLKPLVRWFADPTIGVVSGCDLSVGDGGTGSTVAESGYVGYEMWVRRLETRVGSIVGASGCFYAARKELHRELLPAALSRDFAAPLIARAAGYRSVLAPDAVCLVPRSTSLRVEFRRKVRTMTRGLETLWFKRPLLNPLRHGSFAWMLLSHKLARWLVFLTWPLLPIGLLLLMGRTMWAAPVLGIGLAVGLAGAVGYYWPGPGRAPFALTLPAFAVSSHVAGFLAWTRALRGELNPMWEPTRRT